MTVYHYNVTRSTATRWSFSSDHVTAFRPISEAAHSYSYENDSWRLILLPARFCAIARLLAVALCLCLSVVVWLSVCHKSVFYRNGWTNRVGFCHGSFLPPILHCVNRKFGYLQKIKVLPSGTLSQTPDFRKFRHGISIAEMCYRVSSRKVDAQSVINWAVVGQLSWQYLRAPTLDRCSLSHVIITLCIQHDFFSFSIRRRTLP